MASARVATHRSTPTPRTSRGALPLEVIALVMHVAILQLRQFGERFVWLLEPVAHDLRVVVQLVDEAQILALERPQRKRACFVLSLHRGGPRMTDDRIAGPECPAHSGLPSPCIVTK